jgi:hypothetical protein
MQRIISRKSGIYSTIRMCKQAMSQGFAQIKLICCFIKGGKKNKMCKIIVKNENVYFYI